MEIVPKNGVLLIKKHTNTAYKADMAVVEDDEDKRLITGEILSEGDKDYQKGDTIIFGRYALFLLTVQGDNFYLLDREDVIAKCNYKE